MFVKISAQKLTLLQKFTLNSEENWPNEYLKLTDQQKIQLSTEASEELYKAIENGDIETLKQLRQLALVAKANSNKKLLKILEQDEENRNFIILACKHNQVEIVEYLFQINYCRKIDAKDADGHTAFYYAIKNNNTELLTTLIKKWP